MTGVAYLIVRVSHFSKSLRQLTCSTNGVGQAPGCSAVLARWPNALVPIQLFGLVGGSVGLIASAFVTKVKRIISSTRARSKNLR